MMKTITLESDRDLQHYFDDDCGDALSLARGVYDLDVNHPVYVNLQGYHPVYTELRLHQPLQVAHHSYYGTLWLKPMGDYACCDLTNGAYSRFENVHFVSNVAEGQSHIGKKWNTVEKREGTGIITTGDNDGDNSYTVKVRDCYFAYLNYGINIAQPATKGTIRWVLEHNVFNAARMAINGKRLGEWMITGGDIQLHEQGINLAESHVNMLCGINFERGNLDVILSDDSENNFLHFVRVNRWGGKGKNTKVRNPQRHKALMS